VHYQYDGDHDFSWRFASVRPDTVKFSKAQDLKNCLGTLLGRTRLPKWAPCFSFESDGVLFEEKGEHIFCGMDHLDADRKLWASELPGVLQRYNYNTLPLGSKYGEEVKSIPRERDTDWGQHLLQNPMESPHLTRFLNQLMEALPGAQPSGRAVLCPPSCSCPLYSVAVQWQDVSPHPRGLVQFEVRKCHRESAEIRSVQFRLGFSSETVLELRLRGFTVVAPDQNSNSSSDPQYDAIRQFLSGALSENGNPSSNVDNVNSTNRSDSNRNTQELTQGVVTSLEERRPVAGLLLPEQNGGICDAAELAEVFRLLWRFAYNRDGVTLSRLIPHQHGQDVKHLVGLVLQPLVRQYFRETLVLLPGFRFKGHHWPQYLSHLKFKSSYAVILTGTG
jgi:hypothetical protein